MIKIAAETASAPNNTVTITVGLGVANRPKLIKIITSHDTTTTTEGYKINPDAHAPFPGYYFQMLNGQGSHAPGVQKTT
jgi:hypothetical protein